MTDQQLHTLLSSVQKPGRYCGGELNSVVKDRSKVDIRFAFCFPDTYEVGMSHLGIKILYAIKNRMEGVWCERVFAPAEDMEDQMRRNQIPLFALESRDPIKDFDFIGFTLQYELSYTNVLNMLDLAKVPLLSRERGEAHPIVVAGGPCACNPEPLAEFIDLFLLGEGEELNVELLECYRRCKKEGMNKQSFLQEAAQIQGVYVPQFYEVSYHTDGTICAIEAKTQKAPMPIRKRIVKDLDTAYFPDSFPVPFIEVIHDRAVAEIFRGCIRGCRFCQAGFIYRPVREKSPAVVDRQARELCRSTGYDELSLSSLSTSDYRHLEELLNGLLAWTDPEKINISLPSLRIDNFPQDLMKKIQSVRQSGLTFAPEAGTQRMRDVINKNITEEEILSTCIQAFRNGRTSVKLYFMIGLPTETIEDIEGIAVLAQKIVDAFYALPDKPKGKGVQVSISVSSFVPKPFTPFQWEPQDTMQQLREKQEYLLSCIRTKKIVVSYHDPATSFLEAVLARGDRRLNRVIYEAWKLGCKFDSWGESFKPELWGKAFEICQVDPAFYANRMRAFDEILPWDLLDYGLNKKFFVRENKKAHECVTTPNCREQCAGCGANALCKEACQNA